MAAKENLALQSHKVRKSLFLLGHNYEGLAAVHEEEVATKENLARKCHNSQGQKIPFPLGNEYEGLAAVQEEEVATKENLARKYHKVRKSLFLLGHEYEGLARSMRRR